MPISNSPSRQFDLDLRAPVFTRFRRGIVISWLRIVTFALLDAGLLVLAWQIAEAYGTQLDSAWNTGNNPSSMLLILSLEVGLIAAYGLYDSGQKRRDYFGLVKALTLSQVLLLLIAFLSQPGYFLSRSTFLLSWLLSIGLVCAGRVAVHCTVEYLRKQGTGCYPAFIICHPRDIETATRILQQENRYILSGWVDIAKLERGNWEEIVDKVRYLGVSEVFLCSPDPVENLMFLYWTLRNDGITLRILSLGFQTPFRVPEFSIIGGFPSITFSPPLVTGIDFWVKRCFDFCCALLILLLASPLYLAIALLIKLDSPGPIFYKQTRIGLRGKQFKAWKFRTMVTDADKMQKELEALNQTKDGILFKIKDDPRITRVGKFLRRYSLDELPQVFNVLFGQMSLVGPRPLPVRDVEKFSEHHFMRHEVMPGITGMWQVSGRSDIDNFEDVVRLDLSYIQNWSLWLDLKILLQTVGVVLNKTGAY